MSTLDKTTKKYQKTLGLRIKSIRQSIGYSQLDLAVITNLEKTSISRIENGRTNITLKTLVNLAIGLEVNIKDFFDDSSLDLYKEKEEHESSPLR